MFCSKCGVALPDDSQFCRKCGQAQSVTSTGNSRVTAVVSARAPVVAQLQGNTSRWGLGLLLLLVVCWTGWQIGVHSYYKPQFVSQQPVQLPRQQHKESTGNIAFTVRAMGSNNYKFNVPAGALDVTLKGHFAASGGSGNDIEVFVVSEDEFVNWQNGHPTKPLYNSGKVTQDSINLTLSSDATNYYAVFSNKFSLLTPTAVQASIDLNFYTR